MIEQKKRSICGISLTAECSALNRKIQVRFLYPVLCFKKRADHRPHTKMLKENSFEPLSEDELDEILIEIRSGSDDPLFSLKGENMAELISITPTIKAVMLTEDDLLSESELQEVLKTIPKETLAEYANLEGDDVPEVDLIEEIEPTRMKREGYTITNRADFYWFGHRKWSSRGGLKPDHVTWHHMAGNLTPKQFMAIMQSSRQMSPTISIHTDGTVYAWVPEEMRPWTTGSYAADQAALTFELANDQIGGQWHISDKVLNLAAQIHAEWSKRYGIPTTYSYRGPGINMHKDWANTSCPGPYLEGLIKDGTITKMINSYLNPKTQPKPTWKKNDTGWWYDNGDGTYPASKWQLIDGKWYYFDARGYMVTGWIDYKGGKYYCEENGAMATGWRKIREYWYYFDANGRMMTGWIKWKDNWYCLDDSGRMHVGEHPVLAYFDENGALTRR